MEKRIENMHTDIRVKTVNYPCIKPSRDYLWRHVLSNFQTDPQFQSADGAILLHVSSE